jgi:hypothetical protein
MADNEHEFLEQRRTALEEEFFHKENERKLAKLREQLSAQETKEELRKASGMSDEAVLDRLVELGLRGPTVAALSLVPLIAVAWADHDLEEKEREQILQAAAGKGMEAGTPGHELLMSWLSRQPDDSLFEAWEGYMKALLAQLNDEQVRVLKNQILHMAKLVASSSGGFLGFGNVSGHEKKVIERIDQAFTR